MRKLRSASGAPPINATRPRFFMACLAVVLVAHAALAAWAARKALDDPPVIPLNVADLATAVAIGLALCGVLAWRWPRHALRLIGATAVGLACVLVSPGVVATVALMALNAYVVGQWALGATADDNPENGTLPPVVFILAGIALWIGVMSMTAAVKVHYGIVYAAMLITPLLAQWRRVVAVLTKFGRGMERPQDVVTSTAIAWSVVLGALVFIHLFVVAKPDAGYDANAMHLEFARIVAEHHRWTFDVTRHAWAVMPLGADWTFAAAYLLGGEAAARLANFGFAVIAGVLIYRLIRTFADFEAAIASVTLVASMPLAYLVTGSLFSEGLWTAFLLAALWLAIAFGRTRSPRSMAAFLLVGAGAMQCKVLSVIWLAPLFVYVGWAWSRGPRIRVSRSLAAVACIAATIALAPYVNAWIRTRNPVFPFLNAWFRSPLFDAGTSMSNPLYSAPLRPWSPYEIVIDSGRFIEGLTGALGFAWLLLIPLILFAFLRGRTRLQWLCLGLAVAFFVAVYVQQSYLRYLLPAFVLFAVIGGWALGEFVTTPKRRAVLVAAGVLLVGVNLRFIHAAAWPNAELCLRCAFDRDARVYYLALTMPDRAIGEYLNAAHPAARVGFFIFNGVGPSGFVGYSRSANWHDVESFRALANAGSASEVLAVARKFRLTHVVVAEGPPTSATDYIPAFRDQYTTPIWRYGGRVVAEIKPDR